MSEVHSGHVTILPAACVCGHDHLTDRGEHVELCLECSCIEEIPRCQNCGEEAGFNGWDPIVRHAWVCSRRCALQIEWALGTAVAS